MKLTGKTKEAFTGWMKKYPHIYPDQFEIMPDWMINSLIIEFFDSVGIYISIIKTKDLCQFVLEDDFKNYHQRSNDFNSRPEATNVAIEKANEIFLLR